MAILANNNNNNNYEAPKKAKNDKISTLLNGFEIESVKTYLGQQLLCVDSGVVQLLQVDERPGKGRYWAFLKMGVIMYCREKHSTPSLRLIDPIEGERARELWRMDIKEDFVTQRSSSEYLLTLETRDGEIIGLNFSDAQEANSFQQSVQLQKEKRSRKADRNSYVENAIDAPLRAAPLPPGSLSDSNRSDRVPSITTVGILPTLTKEERKAKKSSFFKTLGATFRGKKKKKRPALTTSDIGNPTNFEHKMHVGLDNLDAEDQETVTKLAEQLKVDKNNQKDMQVLIENVVRRGEQIRQSMRMPPKKKETQSPSEKLSVLPEQTLALVQPFARDPLTDPWGDGNKKPVSQNADSPLQRLSPGGSLVDARNSIKLGQKGGARKTPHMIKQANQPKQMVGRVEATSYPSTSTLSTTTTMNTVSSWQGKDEAPPPPTPQRTTSRRENPQTHDRPRLWDRNPPKEYPKIPQLKSPTIAVKEKIDQKPKSEPSIANGASVAPLAASPPPPPPLPSKNDSVAPPPPPPLPPTLHVTPAKDVQKASNGDGSGQPVELMAAIRNFPSTSALRPVSSLSPQQGRESPQPSSPIQTPGDSILMSIQMELEKRRVHISDSETESEEDSSSDSDWK